MILPMAVSVLTKTYVTLGLVGLAVFEFWTAMYVFGDKGPKRFGIWAMRLHRVGGYLFLAYWIWPMVVGLTLLGQLSEQNAQFPEGLKWQFDGPRFYHAMLGVGVFLLLLLKIGFVRVWPVFRAEAKWMGLVMAATAVVIWIISGLFWLAMMGSPVLER